MNEIEEKHNSNSNTVELINATTELLKAVPVYEDGLKPAVKEVGKSLETIAKAINVALLPISGVIWGAEKIKDFFEKDVIEKLKDVSIEDICAPDPTVAGPALEALKFAGHKENLREMYANLLAKALNKNTTDKTHPSYVEVIKQLTVEEAKLLQLLSNKESYPIICNFLHITKHTGQPMLLRNRFNQICSEINISQDNSNTYYDNLQRLRIMEIIETSTQEIEENFMSLNGLSLPGSDRFEFKNRTNYILKFTNYGNRFVDICIKDIS